MVTAAAVDFQTIRKLWNDLAGNPAARYLVIARIVANHGDDELKLKTAQLIQSDSNSSDQRAQALNMLRVAVPLPSLQPIVERTVLKPQPIRVDPELGRLAIGLNRSSLFRVWCIGRELTRQAAGSGKISLSKLRTALVHFGYEITADHFSRLIREGSESFWDLDRQQKQIYLRSPRRLAPLLAELALQQSPALITTNLPGVRDVYLNVSGSHSDFEAAIYAGWMVHREAPTIAKATLVSLFGRGEDTLRRWEQQLQKSLIVRTNYAQYHVASNSWAPVIPSHAQPYRANVIKEGRPTQVTAYRWRIANTYIPQGIRQHPHWGQAQKVRRNVETVIEQFLCGLPALEASSRPAYLQRPLKLYFDNPKRLKRYVQKKGCDERYLWRGLDRNGVGVFEATLSYGQTHAQERASIKDEVRYFKRQALLRMSYLEKLSA